MEEDEKKRVEAEQAAKKAQEEAAKKKAERMEFMKRQKNRLSSEFSQMVQDRQTIVQKTEAVQ